MSTWNDTGMQVARRSIAVAGLPADTDPTTQTLVAGTFVPDQQIRKMLHGLIDETEIAEASQSCHAVAVNAQIIIAHCDDPYSRVGSLACVIAQVYSHGVLYGQQTAPA